MGRSALPSTDRTSVWLSLGMDADEGEHAGLELSVLPLGIGRLQRRMAALCC
jgi:hypothetical protein